MNQLPRAKPKLAPTDHQLIELAEHLIKAAGGKRAAKRAIDGAKTKAKGGRPKEALQYLEVDTQILWLVAYLQREWQVRCGTIRSRHALIKVLVDLCWRLPDRRRLSVRSLLGCDGLGGANRKDSVIKRLLSRELVQSALADQEGAVRQAQAQGAISREGVFAGLSIKTNDRTLWVKTCSPPLELFEALHQQAPQLRLLPG